MRNNCDNEKRISGIWHNSKTTINGKINKRINGKKSQVFIVGIVILVTFGLISSYMLLSYLYSDKSTDEHLGSYEGAMIDSLIAANKALPQF